MELDAPPSMVHHATLFSMPPPSLEDSEPRARASNAVGHVYLAGPPLEFNSTGVRCLTYDDASHTLAVVRNDECLLYTLSMPAPPAQGREGAAPRRIEMGEAQAVPLAEGEVLAVRASPALPMLAVLRSSTFIEFIDRSSNNSFIQGSRRGKDRVPLTGFFWVQSEAVSCCFVTPLGLELYVMGTNHASLTYVKTLSHQIHWYHYTHESRMVLLGTGERGVVIAAYQFSGKDIIKLPPFELTPYAAPGAPKPCLETNQVRLLTLYGRVYCCHMDPDGARLTLYRFYKDAVVLQHEVELVGGPVELSSYDNLLLVHHIHTGVVLIVDVAQGSRKLTPVANPLPLALHMPPEYLQKSPADYESRGKAAAASASSPPQGASSGASSLAAAAAGQDTTIASLLPNYEVYNVDWQFHPPGIAIDVRNGLLWRLEVFLEGIVATCSAWPQLTGFLQRRRPALHHLSPPQPLMLGVVAGLLQEREATAVLSTVFDALNSSAAAQMRAVAQAGARGGVSGGGAVGPKEVTREVLRWLHEEEAVDAAYLTAAVVKYIASVEAAGLKVPPELLCLLVDCMLEQGHVAQVTSMLEWQPAANSAVLADHLASLAAKGKLKGGWDLSGAMMSRMGAHERHCRCLLKRGQILQALRHCHKNEVSGLPPKVFLDAAVVSGNYTIFCAVYRFCKEHIPDNFDAYASLYDRYLTGGLGDKAPALPNAADLAAVHN